MSEAKYFLWECSALAGSLLVLVSILNRVMYDDWHIQPPEDELSRVRSADADPSGRRFFLSQRQPLLLSAAAKSIPGEKPQTF